MTWPFSQQFLTDLRQAFQFPVFTEGPQNVALKAKGGTFVADGASTVTVADDAVTENSNIIVTLREPGGTVGAIPSVKTITAGTGFTVSGTALDESTYNYLILG